MASALAPDRLRQLAEALETSARVTIPLGSVWRAFAAAFPGRPQGAEERRLLASALEALAAEGRIRLAGPRSWETALGVPLPRWVRLEVARAPSRPRTWRDQPWRPELAWVADLPRLGEGELAFLLRVQRGLVDGSFGAPAPVKYRSLQLTGDEKALERLAAGRLFGEGRLGLDLLGCLPDVLPVAGARVSETTACIVFENAGAFAVARDVLAAMSDPPYGVVLFGDGFRLKDSISSLVAMPFGRLDALHYVGDLDWPGLAIARAVECRAAELSLPPLLPAPAMHAAMLESAAALGSSEGWPSGHRPGSEADLAFLPADVRDRAGAILARGNRIPEEVLGTAELQRAWSRQGPVTREA